MKVLVIICSLLVSVCCYAQSENELFNYSISYLGISKPVVAVGDTVKRGQFLAALAQIPFGPYNLMVQVYKGETEINAAEWFVK
ncbi:MAG TPA: hypothetical protein VEB42_16980 [Chitinophagaceae bacterium]|nr:hypothetical protein [Chitinophagaceae bacterium]